MQKTKLIVNKSSATIAAGYADGTIVILVLPGESKRVDWELVVWRIVAEESRG